jgi:TusA-related sulfurtransferase
MNELDLRGVKCPLNFVKAKLALEKLCPGSELKMVLDQGEAIETVPKSILAEGYEIIYQKQVLDYFELVAKVKT